MKHLFDNHDNLSNQRKNNKNVSNEKNSPLSFKLKETEKTTWSEFSNKKGRWITKTMVRR